MKSSNWPGGVDLGSPNYTLRFPRTSRYDGLGSYAPNSSHPPCGWPLAIALGLAVIGLIFFGPSIAGAMIGYQG